MRKLILINTGSCLFQEAPLTAAVDGRFPASQSSLMRQFKGSPVVLVTRASKGEYGGKTKAEKVVAPFI